MSSFRYRAYDAQGRLATGTIDAASPEQAGETLFSKGLTAFDLRNSGQGAQPWWRREVFAGTQSLRANVAAFTREIATLVGAEIPLADALRVLADQAGSQPIRDLAAKLLADVQGGAALSEAMQKQSTLFTADYVSVVRAGEIGGTLGQVFQELADLLERQMDLRARVQSALLYPIILIVISCVTLGIITGVLVPSMATVFADNGRAPPMTVQVIMAVQARWLEIFLFLLVIAIASVGLLSAALRRPQTALRVARMKLAAPLVGGVLLHQETARFTRTLGTLLRAGVPLLQASTAASAVIRNQYIAAGAERAVGLVREGRSLHRALASETVFPILSLRMISLGEEAGKLDHMLLRVATVFERQTQQSIDRLMTILTPVLTISMAVVVGGLVMTIMSALLSVNELAVQ